ncbi:hypothetical protein [Stutzerimonas nitrititolerans]|uniref:hypothetical protein n=1 Tax=Stutzerimonas nitrititolerans TaxID=2482751 RepID=UPI0028AA88F6|nr:hypothetical protein [Stutzerimonas nitrititolerans]
MKVIAASEVRGCNHSDSQLKAALGTYLSSPPRRTDRLTLLALLASAPLKAHMQADSGLYLAATYPARQNMFALLENVCAQQRLPKPFEFVNSVSNAAGFHVAQQLGLQGPNLFIGAGPQIWGHLLDLAGNDLERAQVRQALVLLVEEDQQDGFSAQALVLEPGGDALSARDFATLSGSVEVVRMALGD